MNQVEIDTEKHILTQTKKLSDGSFEKIFSRNPRGPAGYFTYNCHLCGVPSLPSENALQTHIMGKKHQSRLVYNYLPDADQFRAFIGPAKSVQTIFPGEPIPPGFEDEIKPVCHMDGIVSKVDKPLIGLEYVLELHDMKTKEPLFVCTLCDKRCDPRNVIPQITSHRHRMKYLENHFPKIMNILNRQQRFSTDMSHREAILTRIAKAIEEKSRRQKPTVHEYRKYEMNRVEITDEIRKAKHFDETDFPDCEKLLTESMSKPCDFDDVSSSDSEFMEYNESSRDFAEITAAKFEDARIGKQIKNQKLKEKEKESLKKYKESKSRIDEPIKKESLKKILTPRELSEQSNAKMQEKYKIEKYKATIDIAMEDLDKKFKEHIKNPERHPLYSDEWKAFWSRRYKELLAQGKDANGHDYKPEWITFWMNRMKELHDHDVEAKKAEIRRKLNLSPDFVSKIESDSRSRSNSPIGNRSKSPIRTSPVKRTRSPLKRSRSPVKRSRTPLKRSRSPRRRSRSPPFRGRPTRKSRSPIEISDDSDDDSRRRGSRFDRKRARFDHDDRSRSRFSESPMSYRSSSNFHDTRRSPSPDPYTKDNEINLVSVCRLLSALESEVGILAGRVIDLLTRAVAMEKSEGNSCDTLLFDDDNMILMETVKERLKGGLSAGIVAMNKVPPVKRAIQQIASLIYETNKKKQTMKLNMPRKHVEVTKPAAAAVPADPNDAARLEIARVITESLIEQGRDDISPEELEDMIEAFIQEGLEAAKEEEPEVSKPRDPSPRRVEQKPTVVFEPPAVKETVSSKKQQPEKDESFSELENLTDEDLKTLLRNFSDLTCDEQNHLITYLSKIENTDRQRVERLRKYVDIGDDDIESENEDRGEDGVTEKDEPQPIGNVMSTRSPERATILSDDEYEDNEIVRSMNATVSSEPKPIPSGISTLTNTGAVANELMSSLMTSFMQTSSWDAPAPIQAIPQHNPWDMPMDSNMPYQMPNMMMQQPYQNPPMQNPWQVPAPPQSMQEMPQMPLMINQYPPHNGNPRMFDNPGRHPQHDNNSYRKRSDRPNNMQLTGKGSRR